jgi:O-antigen ligase
MYWLLAVILALPLTTRLMLGSVITGFHEYEALFLYGSDFLVAAVVIWALCRHRAALAALLADHVTLLLAAFLFAGAATFSFAPSLSLGMYVLVRLAVLILFAYSVGALAGSRRIFQAALAVLALAAVLQALVGLAQFKEQGSLGLHRAGEPVLISYTGSASTIYAHGGRVLRIYGTFPHPNVYAAFALLGVFGLAYWYLWCDMRLTSDLFRHPRGWWTLPRALRTLNDYLSHRFFFLRLAIAAAMFVVILGLALSFSRAGWLAGLFGLVVLCLFMLRHRQPGAPVRLLLMVGACGLATLIIFGSLLMPRAAISRFEPAVSDRLAYTDLGLRIVQENIGGVGPGNQVLYGVRNHLYQEYGMSKVWHWEPVHNLYLLIAVEMGWLGLLSFLGFLGMVTWRLVRQPYSLESVTALSLLSAVLVLGLFDHFLWTLQPGRLMLWLAIGLALSRVHPLRKD